MRALRILVHRFRSLFFRGGREGELAREIAIHLEQLTKELIAGGMTRHEAEQEARRQFGPVEGAKEECRDMRRVGIVENLSRDVGYAFRLLRKSPGFTLTAVASLVLGIGANTAIFQLFDTVRLRSLPVMRPEELVSIRIQGEGRNGNFRGRNSQFTYAVWDEMRRRSTSLAGSFAYGDTPVNLASSGEVRNAEGMWVSGSFFPTLGVTPALGRLLSPDDDRPGCGWPGVVISYAFWQREYAGDAGVLSRPILLGGRTVPILGVTPPEFFGVEVGRRFDVAMPICSADARDLNNRMFWFLTVMGRLRDGRSANRVQAELAALSPGVFEATMPDYGPSLKAQYKKMRLAIEPGAAGQSEFREAFERPLALLLAMVGLVLLLACANLANMMLARATAREHEFAVRRSLGASRWRLIQQVLIESLLIALAGAAIGALAAPPIGRLLVRMLSTVRDPIHLALDSNWRVFAFAAAAAVAVTLLFGMAPAFRAARAGTRGATASREKRVFRQALLAMQVALCMVLLSAALLFSRSFRNLMTHSPGFDPQGVLVANVFLDQNRYPPERRLAAIEDLQQRLRAIPGIGGVARSYVIPISGSGWDRGARATPAEPAQPVNLSSISEGYFHVMRLPLLAERDFGSEDNRSSGPVAIVNQAFAAKLFGGRNPVGSTFRLDGPEPPFQIVGLVGDSKYRALSEVSTPIAYFATRQERVPRTTVRFVMRVPGKAEALIPTVKRVLSDADSRLTMRFVVLRLQIEESVLRERMMATLSSAFGVLGMMLALTGVFGVTAYVVSRRHREFGVRMALGATRAGIARMILGETVVVLGAGIVLGALLSLAAGSSISAALFGVKPYNVTTLIAVTLLLGAGGLAASLIPAVRASRVTPVEALRLE